MIDKDNNETLCKVIASSFLLHIHIKQKSDPLQARDPRR